MLSSHKPSFEVIEGVSFELSIEFTSHASIFKKKSESFSPNASDILEMVVTVGFDKSLSI